MKVSRRRAILASVIVVLAVLAGARLYLPVWLTDYINKEIARLDGYSGSVGDVDVHLWRGAYTIYDMNIYKTESYIPVPFVAVAATDLSVEWRALLAGAIVAKIDLYDADLNFAVGNGHEVQGTQDAGWARFVDALSPLEINRFTVNDGRLAFRDFSAGGPGDLFVDDIDLRVENLRAVREGDSALPSPVRLAGTSIGGGKVSAEGAMNILKDIPDFDYDIKLEHADLTAMNDFARKHAGVDFEGGVLDIYVEAAAKDGAVTGYVKPLATGVEMVDIEEDGDLVSIAWQSLVSVFAELFENQSEDQLATRVEISGRLDDPDTDTWSAVTGIFENTFNAFIHDTDHAVDFSDTNPAAGD
jgi:hypothetical protein